MLYTMAICAAVVAIASFRSFVLFQHLPKTSSVTSIPKIYPLDQENYLKPADGACGYFLGSHGEELVDVITNDLPLFNKAQLNVNTTDDGRVCRIEVVGIITGGDLSKPDNEVIATLTEKYGLRKHIAGKKAYEFGTTNRPVYLNVLAGKTGKFYQLLYFDYNLMMIYQKEQSIKHAKVNENG